MHLILLPFLVLFLVFRGTDGYTVRESQDLQGVTYYTVYNKEDESLYTTTNPEEAYGFIEELEKEQ